MYKLRYLWDEVAINKEIFFLLCVEEKQAEGEEGEAGRMGIGKD